MTKTNTLAQESLQLVASGAGATNVEKYEFEPIKGYPMLNWRGKRPFNSTQYYPAQLKEVHGEEVDGWRNKIFWGDNLQVMSHLLKQFRGKVDLIYIDPPFDSKADYKKRIRLKGGLVEGDQSSFEEKQYGDIWNNDEYLQFLYERLVLLRELLTVSGSIYVHCDANRGHYIKCLMDEVFGPGNFRNEIIWKRTSARADSSTYNHVHDTIFYYSRSEAFTWNRQFTEHSEAYLKSKYSSVDKNGRKYRLDNITSPNPRPNMTYEWKGFPPPANGWRYSQEKMAELDADGRIWYPDDKTKRPQLIRYLDESDGRPLDSVWTDIFPVNSQASDRLDYPTQKPVDLLERIIKASSDAESLVFDCFMGSGTTQEVAMRLGRRFIGADINLGAIQTTAKRLIGVADDLRQKGLDGEVKHFTGFELHNVNHYDVFRNPIQAKELLIEALEVQKLEFSTVFDGEKDGRMVKIMPVNRIATRADLNELIAGFDYKAWERKQNENPNRPVEKITLVCMGHEPDLAAQLELAAKPFKIDVEVMDILRDKADLEFKRDSQAKVSIKKGELVIDKFYPMNLLQKLSLQKESVDDWKELVESVLIDWNYDGAVLQPAVLDIPGKNDLVKGAYKVPDDAGTIRVKITDLLSESWEGSVGNGN
ncbi:site-specific DNA-methyltransferase [Paraburkholderia sp. MM5384-R2]|uniref:site-specific DNA-methyltransferase n=1 Tax=Paraburkholderia sp. MM5384-R2 TaxID=2723097 RepID=UPI00161F53F9|nr:site-specific DNA-methyltransferase [Paraburkholderia sp. MM5384-R2]MBB5501061.1 site-specific DNA-methyltransferase (adenine-specific)/adenine-specific DNA-methyltransferase [Paraburkholderia sp. MM5384-R2]